MNDEIRKLIELIREEETLLQGFLTLLDRQKSLLLENRSEEFETTVGEQENLLGDIRMLEQQRIDVIVAIAKGLKIEGEELTLTRLIELTLGDFSDELRELKRSLNRLVERIRTANQVNAHLVHRSMNYLNKSVSWLIDSGDVSTTYSPSGSLTHGTTGAVIVNRTL